MRARLHAWGVCRETATLFRFFLVVRPLRERANTIGGKRLPRCLHGRLRPREKDPGSSRHRVHPLHSTGQISNTGLPFSFGCLAYGVVQIFSPPCNSGELCDFNKILTAKNTKNSERNGKTI